MERTRKTNQLSYIPTLFRENNNIHQSFGTTSTDTWRLLISNSPWTCQSSDLKNRYRWLMVMLESWFQWTRRQHKLSTCQLTVCNFRTNTTRWRTSFQSAAATSVGRELRTRSLTPPLITCYSNHPTNSNSSTTLMSTRTCSKSSTLGNRLEKVSIVWNAAHRWQHQPVISRFLFALPLPQINSENEDCNLEMQSIVVDFPMGQLAAVVSEEMVDVDDSSRSTPWIEISRTARRSSTMLGSQKTNWIVVIPFFGVHPADTSSKFKF